MIPMKTLSVVRRLLFAAALLAAARPVEARAPRVLFDLPYTVEKGYYIVRLDTPVGSRRFLFDTGFTESAISESLCAELYARAEKARMIVDFEGYKATMARVRMDSLGMGTLVFRDKTVIVLPDSSFLVRCFGVEGVAGSDLLQGLAVRFPNADSTISVADDVRAFGKPDRKRSCPIYKKLVCPFIPVTLGSGERKHRTWALFDTGSTGYFSCGDPVWDVTADVERTEGYPTSFGMTERVEAREIVRGRIPAFTVAGTTIADMPFQVTSGHEVVGNALLKWGQVVIDFRHKRFWFLPDPDKPLRVERELEKTIGPSFLNGRLVVGQVWDESLEGIVEPGDRIVMLGTIAVDAVDPCAFLRGEIRPDKPEITIERKDGTRMTIPYKNVVK